MNFGTMLYHLNAPATYSYELKWGIPASTRTAFSPKIERLTLSRYKGSTTADTAVPLVSNPQA